MTNELNLADKVESDERMLLPRHAKGEPGAFAELLNRYRKPVYTYLVRCGITAGRDDLFREIFLEIHTSAASYNPKRPLAPWIFTIAANAVRTHSRKMRVRKIVFRETTGEAESGNPNGLEITGANKTAKWLEKEIEKLPLPRREAVLLCSTGTMDQKSAAEALGIHLNTLKTNLGRAKMALAKALEKRKSREDREASL